MDMRHTMGPEIEEDSRPPLAQSGVTLENEKQLSKDLKKSNVGNVTAKEVYSFSWFTSSLVS